jgi:hypothetical protein
MLFVAFFFSNYCYFNPYLHFLSYRARLDLSTFACGWLASEVNQATYCNGLIVYTSPDSDKQSDITDLVGGYYWDSIQMPQILKQEYPICLTSFGDRP